MDIASVEIFNTEHSLTLSNSIANVQADMHI